ncbi:protein javelin [Anabrus simplex]|uniref:protein javelin n=1 Tax=Anabrus simplex TaxID=316456 RepID=UPI0035A2AC9F
MSRRPQVLRVTDSVNTLRRPKTSKETNGNLSPDITSPTADSNEVQTNNKPESPVIVATFTVANGNAITNDQTISPLCGSVSPPIISKDNLDCKEITLNGNKNKQQTEKHPAFRTLSCTPQMDKKVTSSVGLSRSSYSLDRRSSRPALGRSIPEYLNQLCMTEDASEKGSNPTLTSTLKIQNARKIHQNGSQSDGTSKVAAFDGLMQYLQEYRHGLRELLVNNNVVIIEPIREADNRHDNRKVRSAQGFNKESTCRITGATIKKANSEEVDGQTLTRQQSHGQPVPRRHFFYHPKRVNRELVDEELPDPDTVRNARKLFEKTLKMRTPSDEFNIRNDHLTLEKNSEEKSTKDVINKEITSPKPKSVSPSAEKVNKKRLTRYLTVDAVLGHNNGPKRWTDSGSLSSGVSSDLSCYETETDADSPSRNSSHKEDVFSSDDEHDIDAVDARNYYIDDGDEGGHYVAPEVLEKIRACGTTVTYYGGRVISSSKGPIMSPMTLAIMNEIRQGCESTRKNAGNKIFQEDYLGVKFRLVKSNSCGSRLELAGTEDDSERTSDEGNATQNEHKAESDKTLGKLQPVHEVEENFVKNQIEVCEKSIASSKNLDCNPESTESTIQEQNEENPEINSSSKKSEEKLFENGLDFWKRNESENIKSEPPKINFLPEKPKVMPLRSSSLFDDMEFEEFEVLEYPSTNNTTSETTCDESCDTKKEGINNENTEEDKQSEPEENNILSSNEEMNTGSMTSWAQRRSVTLNDVEHQPKSPSSNQSTC